MKKEGVRPIIATLFTTPEKAEEHCTQDRLFGLLSILLTISRGHGTTHCPGQRVSRRNAFIENVIFFALKRKEEDARKRPLIKAKFFLN